MFLKLPGRIWLALRRYAPGTLVCTAIALAANFLSAHFGGPLLLYALLFGLSFHFLNKHASVKPGVDFCGRSVLRIGVALLGARITVGQVVNLGPAVAVGSTQRQTFHDFAWFWPLQPLASKRALRIC